MAPVMATTRSAFFWTMLSLTRPGVVWAGGTAGITNILEVGSPDGGLPLFYFFIFTSFMTFRLWGRFDVLAFTN
jgi:hypothetical protein